MSEYDRPGFVGIAKLMRDLEITYYDAKQLVQRPGVEKLTSPLRKRTKYRLEDVRRELEATKTTALTTNKKENV